MFLEATPSVHLLDLRTYNQSVRQSSLAQPLGSQAEHNLAKFAFFFQWNFVL